jgi:hypothetical protein
MLLQKTWKSRIVTWRQKLTAAAIIFGIFGGISYLCFPGEAIFTKPLGTLTLTDLIALGASAYFLYLASKTVLEILSQKDE